MMINSCSGCSGCFLCSPCDDRGGLVAESTALRVLADRSPLGSNHVMLTAREHVTSARHLMQRRIGIARALETISAVHKRSLVFEHGMLDGGGRKGCIAHAHIHCVGADNSTTPNMLFDMLIQQNGADNVIRNKGPDFLAAIPSAIREYYWVYDTERGRHAFAWKRSPSLPQALRRAFAAASRTTFVPYEQCVDLAAARTTTQLLRERLPNDWLGEAETDVAPIILIEGLSASGKTVVSSAVARALGGLHIPSGLYFCGAALKAIERGGECMLHSPEAAASLLSDDDIAPISEEAASESVRMLASQFARNPVFWDRVAFAIRREVNVHSAMKTPVVIDSRGFSARAFEDASVKIWLTAEPVERKRRVRGREGAGPSAPIDLHMQAARDRADGQRLVAAAVPAADSIVISTDGKSIAAIAEIVAGIAVAPVLRAGVN
jgi:cytidylate kinase